MVQNVQQKNNKKNNKKIKINKKIINLFKSLLKKKFPKLEFKKLSKKKKIFLKSKFRIFKLKFLKFQLKLNLKLKFQSKLNSLKRFKKNIKNKNMKWTLKSKNNSIPLFKFKIPKDKCKLNFLATSQRLELYTNSLGRFRKEEDRFDAIYNIQKLKYYFILFNLNFKTIKNYSLLKKNYKFLKFKLYNKLKWKKKIILTGMFLNVLNFLTYIYLFTYSNILFFNKLTNLVMKCGMKYKAENLILKFLEILKSKYQIINPFERFKKLIYLNLVPPIMTKLVGFKIKKTIGVKVNVAFRFNKSLRLFIKGAQNLNISMYTGLVVEFINLLTGFSYLQEYNKQTWKTINDYTLYFPKYRRRIFYSWRKYQRLTYKQINLRKEKEIMINEKKNIGSYNFINFWNPIYKDRFKFLKLNY
jgi:ribosomal protein S7